MKHPIRTSLLAALCCAVCLVLESAETAWPRAGLLISPEALAPLAKDFVIIDAREKKAFEESRIPGAVWN